MRRRDCSCHQGAGHDAHHRAVHERLPKRSFSRCCPQGPAGGSLPSCERAPASEEEFQPLTALKSPGCPSRRSAVPRCLLKIPSPSHPPASCCNPTVPASSPAPRHSSSPQGHQVQHLGDSAAKSPEAGVWHLCSPGQTLPAAAGGEGKGRAAQTQTPALPAPASVRDPSADLQRAIS